MIISYRLFAVSVTAFLRNNAEMNWDYLRLLATVSLAGFIGLLFNEMILFMFIGTLLYAVWIQNKWHQMWQWLQNPKKNPLRLLKGLSMIFVVVLNVFVYKINHEKKGWQIT